MVLKGSSPKVKGNNNNNTDVTADITMQKSEAESICSFDICLYEIV